MLSHARGRRTSEWAVPTVGAAIYCARLAPPLAVRLCGIQLCMERVTLRVPPYVYGEQERVEADFAVSSICEPLGQP